METLDGVKKIAVEACLKYTDSVEEIRHLRARNAALEAEVARLHKEIKYQYLQTSFLLGQISKDNFKALAAEYAEPLNIERDIESAKAALEARDG